jgi:hypothetical protein
VELREPANPVVGGRVNTPGFVVNARAADHTWFTATAGPGGLTISTLYRRPGTTRAYLERQLSLEGSASGPVMDGDTLFATIGGQLVAVDLGQPDAPRVISRTPVPGATTSGPWVDSGGLEGARGASPPVVAADVNRVVGGHVFVMLAGTSMLVYDARQPAQPRLLDRLIISPRGAHPVRPAPDGRAVVPRAEWGVEVVDLAGR